MFKIEELVCQLKVLYDLLFIFISLQMKRRTAAWSNSNPLTASSHTSSSADKAEKTSSGSGGTSVAGSSRGPQYMRGQRGGVGRKRARKG